MLISDKKFSKNNKKFKNYFYKLKKNKFRLNKNDAFIIFTSGTTSKPKGAILTDESLKNNIKGIIKQLNLNQKIEQLFTAHQIMQWAFHKF